MLHSGRRGYGLRESTNAGDSAIVPAAPQRVTNQEPRAKNFFDRLHLAMIRYIFKKTYLDMSHQEITNAIPSF
jgi:hypothetical protein